MSQKRQTITIYDFCQWL